jgi:hypothetical protein
MNAGSTTFKLLAQLIASVLLSCALLLLALAAACS